MSTTSIDDNICIGCGLCCDSTLLSHLAVSDESDLGWPLRALGVEVIVEADPPVFALPCPALNHGRCAVFHQHRPHACAQFECDLAQAVARHEVTTHDARRIIDDTISLRDRVRAGTADATELAAMVRAHFRDVGD